MSVLKNIQCQTWTFLRPSAGRVWNLRKLFTRELRGKWDGIMKTDHQLAEHCGRYCNLKYSRQVEKHKTLSIFLHKTLALHTTLALFLRMSLWGADVFLSAPRFSHFILKIFEILIVLMDFWPLRYLKPQLLPFWFSLLSMAGSSNTDVDFVGSALLFPDEECIADHDDDFLVIQRATNAVSIIDNDLFSYSRSEFINYL